MTDLNKAAKVTALVAGTLIFAMWAAVMVTIDQRSGVAAVVRFACLFAAVYSFVKPKQGFFVLVIVLANIEWVKRLAIFYGATSVMTVTELLAVPLIIVSCIIAGTLGGMARGAYQMTWGRFLLFAMAGITVVGLYVIAPGSGPYKIQLAVNSGLYFALVPCAMMLFKTREEGMRIMRFAVFMFLPWALWVMKQYFYGYSEIEWHYIYTGISPVLTNQMLGTETRPFGLASSQASLSAISFIAWFAIWHAMNYRQKRGLYIVVSVIYALGLFYCLQRTALVLPIFALIAYPLLRNLAGTIVSYVVGIMIVGAGIVFSDSLLWELDNIQEKIAVESGPLGSTLRITTFSDRLRGWSRLKNPDAYSLTGKRIEGGEINAESADFSHDMINKALINYGVLGLFIFAAIGIYCVYRMHKLVLNLPPGLPHRTGSAMLAFLIPSFMLSVLGGGNFNTTPVNFFTWMFVALLFLCADRQKMTAEEKKRAAEVGDERRIVPTFIRPNGDVVRV